MQSQLKAQGNVTLTTQKQVSAQEEQAGVNETYVGEIFGVKVPLSNYNFVKTTVQLFGNRGEESPKSAEEIEETTWEQLLLSLVAFSKNITVSDQEVDEELGNILRAENVAFDYKKDRAAYENWLQEKIHEPPTVFENQIRHLLQLNKLRDTVKESINPEVTEEEARQEFNLGQSMLSLELAKFQEEKEADEFYKKVKGRPRLWEKEKRKNPQAFKQPGFVTLLYLNKLWQIPRDALEKMLQKEAGEIYPPRSIYKGWGVFKILAKKIVEQEHFEESKEGYYEKLRQRKKNEGLNEWIKELKVQANIKIYQKGGGKDEKDDNGNTGP